MNKTAAALQNIFLQNRCSIFGYAALSGLVPPELGPFDRAVSFGLALDPHIVKSVKDGPNRRYAELYTHINRRLDELAEQIATGIRNKGGKARVIPASIRSDPITIRGEFPHKTAATRAGLGWIGKNAQLVTRSVGPWLRLGTVLTDLPLPTGNPIEKSLCGKCDKCVDACPTGALFAVLWNPGMARERMLDVRRCDRYKKENFYTYNQGNNCGICTAVCPIGQKQMKAGGLLDS